MRPEFVVNFTRYAVSESDKREMDRESGEREGGDKGR